MSVYYEGDGITLHLGDCREITDWLTADVLVTDPPYGISWPSQSMNTTGKPRVANSVANDESADVRDEAILLWGNRPAIIFGSWRIPRPPATQHRLIWHKRQAYPGFRTAPFYPAEEEIYILGRGFVGGPTPNVIATNELRHGASGLSALTGHPTPKPVPLMQKLLSQCPPGMIADPFAGSGATLLAAKLEGRSAIGVELSEQYCEIIATRLAQGVLDFGDAS